MVATRGIQGEFNYTPATGGVVASMENLYLACVFAFQGPESASISFFSFSLR